jgi:hypothetical protein
MNKTDLFSKLDYYRAQTTMARQVAIGGYIHCMKYHRAANLIDFVFRTLHIKLLGLGLDRNGIMKEKKEGNDELIVKYEYTGYDMREVAIKKSKEYEESIKKLVK